MDTKDEKQISSIMKTITQWAAQYEPMPVGFCNSALNEEIIEYYKNKKQKDHLCEFELRNQDEAIGNIASFWPEARTAIVALLPIEVYSFNPLYAPPNPVMGTFASGTLAPDYHLILQARLDNLGQTLKENYDIKSKSGVDTTPLSDRALAVKANLGLVRRNGMFYHKKYGSYVHIGFLLIDHNLGASAFSPPLDPCGACRRCVDKCPGQAIVGDGSINSLRCISYLTQKKTLTYEEGEKLGNNLYGCDICQRVCPANPPVNKIAKSHGLVDPKVFLTMSKQTFATDFKPLTGGWRGLRTMKRNALYVLNNMAFETEQDTIAYHLKDPSDLIRSSVLDILTHHKLED